MTRHATDEHRLVLQAWLGTRLLFLLISFAIAAWGGTPLSRQYANWDVAHFDAIARNGYAVTNDMAFFPGLPLLMRALMTVGIEPALGGVLLSLFGSLAATWALVRIAGAWGAIAWLLVPTGVFTFVGYTESLFCAAAFWAWERATKGRWGAAAVLAAGACTLRVSGIFLIGALAILAWSQAGRGGAKVRGRTSGTAWWTRAWAWLLVPVAVVASYATYLHSLTGSWAAWFSAQAAGWSRGFTWPWQSFLNSWASVQPGAYPEHPEWVWVFRGEMLSMAVGLIVTLICLFRRRIAEAAWVGVQVLAFSLSYWFMSVNRAVILWFPLWRQIGEFVESRPRTPQWRTLGWAAVIAALAIQALWAWLFFTGRWSS